MLIALLAAAATAAIIAEWRSPLNSDAAWVLVMARRVIDGGSLYRSTIEINPPLVVWLNLPVVALARILVVDESTLLRLLVYAGIVGSSAASAFLLKRSGQIARAAPAAAAMLSVLLLLPLGGFAEREHLITALLLPVMALTVVRMSGGLVRLPIAVGVGVACAVAIALKPYFLGVWLLLALARWRAVGQVVLALEDLVVISLGGAYILMVAAFTPRYFALVRVLGPAYATYSTQPLSNLLLGSPEVWCFGGGLVAWLVCRGWRTDIVGSVLATVGLGSLLAAVSQGKGWFYHFYPLAAFAMLLGLHAFAAKPPARPSALSRTARVLALAFFLLGAAPLVVRAGRVTQLRAGGLTYPRNREIHDLLAALAEQRGARSIEVLSTDITPTFPLVQLAGLTDNQSLPHLWLPTTVYRTTRSPDHPVEFHTPENMGAAERLTFEAVVRDVVEGRPDLLLVESRPRNQARYGFPGGFDHLAYYSQDSAFNRTLGAYRAVGNGHGFQLLRRLSVRFSAPR